MPDEEGWKKNFNSNSYSTTYDKVIDLFSLRRVERFNVLLNLLPRPTDKNYKILELGTGSGILSEILLKQYPKAIIYTVEGAEKMIEQAKIKITFQENQNRIKLFHADFSKASWMSDLKFPYDLIFTFDSLHHLSHLRKKELYGELYDLLINDGYFLISDHITSQNMFYDDPQYNLWIQEILKNLKSVKKGSDISLALEKLTLLKYKDIQNLTLQKLHEFFTSSLKREGDNPMPIMDHVDELKKVGFKNVIIEYRYANYAIISCKK